MKNNRGTLHVAHCMCLMFLSSVLVGQNRTTGFYYVKDKSDSTKLFSGKRDTVWIDTVAIITARDYKSVKLKRTNNGYGLEIELNKDATETFRLATAKWIQKKIAIVTDGEVVSVPIVVAEIGAGKIMFTGGYYTREDLINIKMKLDKAIKEEKKRN